MNEWKEKVTIPDMGRQVAIPLERFHAHGIRKSDVSKLVLAFRHTFGLNPHKGTIFIGDVGFGK
jgi:hypothetical protein